MQNRNDFHVKRHGMEVERGTGYGTLSPSHTKFGHNLPGSHKWGYSLNVCIGAPN